MIQQEISCIRSKRSGIACLLLAGQTVVAVPGVNSLNHLPEMRQFVKENGTKRIMTAFDMGYLNNPLVRDAYHNLAATISGADLEYCIYLWDPEYKGLDNYVWHCRHTVGRPILEMEEAL